MQNLKILIVEDELLIANDIRQLLLDWGYQVVGIATTGEEALPIFTKELPDIAIVDVQLAGQIDGIDTVQYFNAINRVPVIYLTAQADISTVERAKMTHPAAYLLKPFNERHLHISLELAISNFSKNLPPQLTSEKEPLFAHEVKLSADVILKKEDAFFIKQNYRFVKLKIDDLVYIEADRNHSYLVMKNQKLIVRMPLTEVIERLSWNFMVRVHRSYAINIKYVDEFDETEVIVNGKAIPLTLSYKDDFLKKFNVI
jgi:DNA-binding LytR/AlgR family response regulator